MLLYPQNVPPYFLVYLKSQYISHSNKIPHNPAPINTFSFCSLFNHLLTFRLVHCYPSTLRAFQPRFPGGQNARCTRRVISASMPERRCCAMPMANVWMKTRRGDTANGGGFPRWWCVKLLARNWRKWCNWDNFGHVFLFLFWMRVYKWMLAGLVQYASSFLAYIQFFW